jgi:serine/threonine-protein kinase
MEYLPGDALDRLLEREGALAPTRAVALLGPIFDAVAHLHDAHILHRDLKPSSIVVSASGTARLGDFGLAVRPVAGRDDLTRIGFILGTPAYMSPEQVLDLPLDFRSDLFSLGLIVFECLTGRRAITETSFTSIATALAQGTIPAPSRVHPGLPPAFDAFVARMLAREPQGRFAGAREARVAFAESLGAVAAA